MNLGDFGLQHLCPRLGLFAAVSLAACGDTAVGTEPDSDAASSDASVDPTADAVDGAADTSADTAVDAPVDPCGPPPGGCPARPAAQPPRLSEHGAAYVDADPQMVVFGGTTGVPENCDPAVASAYVADTWVFDDRCDTWELLSAPGPAARGRHAMAAGGGDVWLFGGRFRAGGATTGDYSVFGDLWRFDPAARRWEEVVTAGPQPSNRMNALLAWDSTRSRLLLFGGNASGDGVTTEPLDDVWSFDPPTRTWEELSVTGPGPSPRLAMAGTYDAARDRLVVYSGFDSFAFTGTVSYFRDVWYLDLDGGFWERASSSAGPDGRFGSAMVHDTRADNYVVFGGHDDQLLGNRNDNWIFDPTRNTWALVSIGDEFQSPQIDFCEFPPDFTDIEPALPERRNYHTLVWSETCGHALVFGGKTDCGSANDVWTYRDEAWQEVVPATTGEVCVRFRSNPDNCANLCF